MKSSAGKMSEKEVIELQPIQTHLDFFRTGDIYAKQGKFEEAARLFLRGLQLNPGNAEGYNNLGVVLHELKRDYDALVCYKRAISIRPQYGIALNNFGVALASLSQHEEAVQKYHAALSITPRYAEALNNLGISLQALARPDEAVLLFEEAVLIKPSYLEARKNLANIYREISYFEKAIVAYKVLLDAQPRDVAMKVGLATSLLGAEKTTEAIVEFEAVVELAPEYADAYAGLAVCFQQIGQIKSASQCLERAIEINPKEPRYYWHWSLCAKIDRNNETLPKLLAMVFELPRLSKPQRIHLHFALNKALSDIDQNEKAFSHLMAGNALRRSQVRYNEGHELQIFARTKRVFTRDFMSERKDIGLDTTQPVFIVGMPRSGSTLLEQILSVHPNVVAGGELLLLKQAVKKLVFDGNCPQFPEAAGFWTPEQFLELGKHYLAGLRDCIAKEPKSVVLRITDKRLDNFLFVGLIKILFPKAKIVHARRDPMDTCLSCFSRLFETMEFSYDLGELGRRYQAYWQLMHHWDIVLPPNSILDVRYENVVLNTEFEIRRLLEYCGLDWSSNCLRFYESSRAVRTASMVQVRRPIYAQSVGRWRPRRNILEPLLNELSNL